MKKFYSRALLCLVLCSACAVSMAEDFGGKCANICTYVCNSPEGKRHTIEKQSYCFCPGMDQTKPETLPKLHNCGWYEYRGIYYKRANIHHPFESNHT